MKTLRILIALTTGFLFANQSLAQSTFNVASGNWSNPSNWSAGVPDASDPVTINAGSSVTVDVAAVCASISYTAGTTSSTISINSNASLSVTGNITMTNPTAANTIQTLNVDDGEVNCAGLIMTNTSDSTRRNRLDITNGTINITTTLTFGGGAAGENQLRFFGTGLLNFGGSTFGLGTNDTYIRGNGSIELSRNGNVTLVTGIYYNRIIISGSNNKTISSTSMNKLYIRSGGTALANNTLVVNDSTIIDGKFSITSSTGNRTFNGHILINSGGVWSNTGNEQIAVNNGITNNGTFTSGTGTHTFGVNEQDLKGTGPFIFAGAVTIASPAVLNNYDSVSVAGNFTVSSGATWRNKANSQLRLASNVTNSGTMDASECPNAVHYNRAGTQTAAIGTYCNFYKTNSNTLTLAAGTTVVNGNVVVTAGTIACGANTFDLNGNIIGSGIITQTSGGNIFLAGDNLHTGTHTISTSTFTYDGNVGTQTVRNLTYNNLSFDSSATKIFAGDVVVSGIINFIGGSASINGNRLTMNGVVSRTSGFISGSASSKITIGGSAANAGLFFLQTDSSTRSLSNLTSTRANGTTLNNRLDIIDSLNVSSGNITSNGNLVLISDATNTARVARIVSGGVTGNVTVQRFIPGGSNKRKWRYLSSPVNISGGIKIWQLIDDVHVTGVGNVTNGFDNCTTCSPSLRTYTESVAGGADAGWTNPADTSVVISTGTGFELFVRGNRNTPNPYINWSVPNDATIDYIGTINSGTINLNISYTNNGDVQGDGFNLVGNPYPSQINWLSSGWTKTNLELYFWTYNPDPSVAAYGIFSTQLGTGTNDITRYIASGQGFFVKATGTLAVLGFTENVKRVDAPYNFFKEQNEESAHCYFRLKATNSKYRDELLIALDSTSTLALGDSADAVKFFGERLNFYSKSSELKSLAINQTSFPNNPKEDTINLSLFTTDSGGLFLGTHTIELTETNKLRDGIKIDLVDNYTNTRVNLNNSPTYTFEVEASTESFGNNRFDLVLYNVNVGVPQTQLQKFKVYPNPVNGNWLKVDGVKNRNENYSVYNVLGSKVKEGKLQDYKVDVSSLNPGVYFLRIENNVVKFIIE